ncbi:dynein family light intermediate chain [Sporodiniella umbellata]|nr:dynein family light intermediate chain [Sporodiniella umbellata]
MLASVIPSQSVSTTSIAGQQQVYIPEKDEIWSGILKGVASTKMVPTKNVLILGETGVGKSTLVDYLRNDPGPQQAKTDEISVSAIQPVQYTQKMKSPIEETDLALGYTFIDVKDEENEAAARLGCYQLGLFSPEFLPLLKFAIRAETVGDACVVIVLDWSRPWRFLETLQAWIGVLRYLINDICKEKTIGQWSEGKAALDELKETLENYLQTYSEPSHVPIVMTASTSTSSITTLPNTPSPSNPSQADQVILPLTHGCLTTNFGLPIVVVCSKSDTMNTLEQTHDYKEEQFDYIQQTLRTICMKYGAALFYTSSYQPYTYHHLREYILHRLLSNQNGKTYPFQAKAQVVERDTVFVPSGWDSWGKIKVLREGFDCESVSEGWDENTLIEGHSSTGAMGMYEEIIPNEELEHQPEHVSVTTVCEDEQTFYERHFETLQKTQDTLRKSSSRSNLMGPVPMDLPRIETRKSSGLDKKKSYSNLTQPQPPQPAMDGQNGPSHAAIASFFESLLKKKGSGAASPTALPTSTLPPSNGRSELDLTQLNQGVDREHVAKELDQIRQYTASTKQ